MSIQKSAMTDRGPCQASLQSQEQIDAIRRAIEDTTLLEQIIRMIEAIKDPTRFKIVYLLYRYEKLCVCDLANILRVSSSAVSQHLRKLKDMQLIAAKRDGLTLFYRLTDAQFSNFLGRILAAQEDPEKAGLFAKTNV